MGEVGNTRSKPRSDIVCLEGNGARPSHRGIGFLESEVMYTLNSTEVHAVCIKMAKKKYGSWSNRQEEESAT